MSYSDELWTHGVMSHSVPNVNLGKLVPLEVHDRLQNAKITKKYFPMSKWGLPYTIGKLKKKAFQQAKDHSIQIHV